ncbi:uncharacterized protein PV09_00394 [Verruconis gallopava]|uniref:Uncharacterized protein n=1 Tax=Verruconis gallopava TaxID=253628 RepID=A0A0D2AS68_9PEZI|nr:uncharacterized protein PV09_00394 [Verruconis gallopava]KIW09518.1 hypothetical protein PV09_00394 [Verruconis gallopava]
MQSNVLSFPGHPCGFRRYISLITDRSSCVPFRVRVLAMSTTRDGDVTTSTLQSIFSLRQRLDAACHASLVLDNYGNHLAKNSLIHCQEYLNLWIEEHVGRTSEGRKFRDFAARNEDKVRWIREIIEEASLLMLHCECKLGIPQSSVPQANRIVEDDVRHDCFPALQTSLEKLQQPDTYKPPLNLTASIIRPLPPSNAPSTPPAPSSRVGSSTSPTTSARVSPASYEEITTRDDKVYVKQEQSADMMETDSQDRFHYRKDSHLGSQSAPNGRSPDVLPPMQDPAGEPLAQIPNAAPYSLIFLQNSPPTNVASNTRSPYGNEQQTVMMSPNMHHHPTLHPPLSLGPGPTNFSPASVFYDYRPPSRTNGSQPQG